MKQDYYIYALLDIRTEVGSYIYENYTFKNKPYYIGAGRGDRLNDHSRKKHLNRKVNRFKDAIIYKHLEMGLDIVSVKVCEDLTLEEAEKIESYLIEIIGRRDLKTGPLTNLTAGGRGLKSPSEETKKKLSDIFSGEGSYWFGKHLPNETKILISEKLTGLRRTPEQKKRISDSKSGENHPLYGKPCSKERRKNISRALKGRKGTPFNEDRKRIYSEMNSGEKNPMYGINHTEETKKKMSDRVKKYYRKVIFQTIELVIRNGLELSLENYKKCRENSRVPYYNSYKYVSEKEIENYILNITSAQS